MKTVSRIDALSVMKVMGIVYAGFGLLAGALLTVMSLARMMAGGAAGQLDNPLGSVSTLLFGLLGIVVFPALYGIFGALMAGLVTVIYNVVARKFGGLKFEVAESQPPAAPAPASHGFV